MKVIRVGRGKNNDEVLNDSTVSRNHLEIFFGDDGLVVVTDLNSANGTTVNGKKITTPTKLDSLDILKAGNSLIKWKNYLKDSNDDNEESNTEIKEEPIITEMSDALTTSTQDDNNLSKSKLAKMSVEQLKEHCGSLHISVEGNKTELINRILLQRHNPSRCC